MSVAVGRKVDALSTRLEFAKLLTRLQRPDAARAQLLAARADAADADLDPDQAKDLREALAALPPGD